MIIGIKITNMSIKKKYINIILIIIISIFISLFFLYKRNIIDQSITKELNIDIPIFSTNLLLDTNKILSDKDLSNSVSLINFFASWCIPCKAEHSLLMDIKKKIPDLLVIGFNHKDKKNDAINFLNNDGNPYDLIGIDNGDIGYKFGVMGLPETYITNEKGKIIFKHTGPLTKRIIKNQILPLI